MIRSNTNSHGKMSNFNKTQKLPQKHPLAVKKIELKTSSSSYLKKAPRKVSQGHDDLSDMDALQACLNLYEKLPKQSRYAQHKRAVLSKAIEILKVDKAKRTEAQVLDLERMMKTLFF
uniref:Uncharacterized protein n=1 Tax=Polytomella parva TaxID=51329 RepID=A0A7S0ULX8_9CHLO|mmetsp:Transcript_1430/g.2079  ORF Transcript_1430/g.2079 Transcript_1430/m.2079 type:complete len:118 (+) Transcript_1430:83-436(+)